MTRIMAGLLVLAWIPAFAQVPSGGAPGSDTETQRAPELPGPARISLQLKDVTIEEAAKSLAELLGVTILPAARADAMMETGADQRFTLAPDRARRASFSWSAVPVSEALREFCRAFGCSLIADYRGNLMVSGRPLPTGLATVSTGGYDIQVTDVGYAESRAVDDDGNFTGRRSLQLQFGIRADKGHAAFVHGLENVRVEDEAGRDLLDSVSSRTQTPPARASAFPDERLQTVRFDWPYAQPERLRLIEGDLVLYRRAVPTTVRLLVPAFGQFPDVRETGDVQMQVVQGEPAEAGFRATVRVVTEGTTGAQVIGHQHAAEFELRDGRRVPATVNLTGWTTYNGSRSSDYLMGAPVVAERPAAIRLTYIRQYDPERRLHFRIENPTGRLRGAGSVQKPSVPAAVRSEPDHRRPKPGRRQ